MHKNDTIKCSSLTSPRNWKKSRHICSKLSIASVMSDVTMVPIILAISLTDCITAMGCNCGITLLLIDPSICSAALTSLDISFSKVSK